MNNDMLAKMKKLRDAKEGKTESSTATTKETLNSIDDNGDDIEFDNLLSDTSMSSRIGIKMLTHSMISDIGIVYNLEIRTAINAKGRKELNGKVIIQKETGSKIYSFAWDIVEFDRVYISWLDDKTLDGKKYKAKCANKGVDFYGHGMGIREFITCLIRETFAEKEIDMMEWSGNDKVSQVTNNNSGFPNFDVMSLFGMSSTNSAVNNTPAPKQTVTATVPPVQSNNNDKRIDKLEEDIKEIKSMLEALTIKDTDVANKIADKVDSIDNEIKDIKGKGTNKPQPKVAPAKSTKSDTTNTAEFVPRSKNKKTKRLEDIEW